MFCLRVMVGVIILYDHVHPIGAFAKTSPIDVSIVTMAGMYPRLSCRGRGAVWAFGPTGVICAVAISNFG